MELELNFDRIMAFKIESFLAAFLHSRVWSLSNQLLLKYSVSVFLKFYRHIVGWCKGAG